MKKNLPMEENLEAGYREMAADEAREAEALDWSEATLPDVADEDSTPAGSSGR